MAMAAEAIIFAINSAIRLGRNAQRAYAKSLTSKSIVLPLPKFSGTPNEGVAENFFDSDDTAVGGAQFLDQLETIKDIHQRLKTGMGAEFPSDEEIKVYINHYQLLSSLLRQEKDADFKEGLKDNQINADELVALLRIRQYNFDRKKHTKPLQMVAGTIVEIGIDYFNKIPGALNEQSASGRAIKHFLGAMDDLKFSDNEQLNKHSHKILPQLFISAAETVVDLSQDLTKDPKIQAFIQSAGRGIADDLFKRMDGLDADRQDKAIQWGRLLLRSAISNSGHYVFNSSDRLFNTNKGGDKLIKSTCNVLLEAILQDPHKLSIRDGLNAKTLDRLFKSTFTVLADHPALISNKNGFRQIVAGVSEALAANSFRRPGLLPELVRLVVENTGKHLNLFWKKEGDPPGAKEGAEGLLISTLQLTLAELSAPVGDEKWRPHLSKRQLLFIVEEMMDYVVQNPAWIERKVDDKPLLAATIRATMDALAQLPKEERFSAVTLEWLLELNLRTVASNELVLHKIKWGDNDKKEALLQQALDLVFAHVFHSQNSTAGDRLQFLTDLMEYVMEAIIQEHPNKKGLLLIDLILFKEGNINFANGFNAALADDLIEAALSVLSTHPELISNKAAFSQIISEIAGALKDGGYKQDALLIEIVRLTLESAAINAGLIVNVETDDQSFLLVTFVREILLALSNKPDSTAKWQPVITPAEVVLIVDSLLNELIQHPEWFTKGENGQFIFREAMMAVRKGLEETGSVILTSEQLEYLLILALRTAATSPKVLEEIPWGTDAEKKSVLERAFAIIASFVFEELHISGAERIQRLEDMMEYIMDVILTYHPDRKGLILLNLLLFDESDIDYSGGFDEEFTAELLDAALTILTNHADLVSNDEAVQQIVSDTAAALDAADFREPGVLPELVRLILENTAANSHLVVNASADKPKFLLVIALQTILEELSQTNPDGKWEPQITADDLLLMVENMLDELIQHPEWLSKQDGKSDTLWGEVVRAVMDALRNLPKECRLQAETLETILMISLRTSANSPKVLDKINWFDDGVEKAILNQSLDILIQYVYPPNSTPTPERWELFLDLLDFVLDNVIESYPDKRSLLIIDMLFFESEVDLSHGFDYELAEDLIEAALEIVHSHPDLLTRHTIFQKILRDVAGALRASKTDIKHLLPEFFRLVLLNASGHLETLMKISPNSPKMLLAVAMEQTLRVITQKKRGVWRPEFSEEQLLNIVGLVLEHVVDNPQWVSNDKLIQLTFEAIYSAFDEITSGKTLPYHTVELLIVAALDAVGQRQHLVLEVVQIDGSKKQVVLEYALGNLFVNLYDENGDTSGSWTLTQSENLQSLLSHYLLRLAVGPADKKTADGLNQAVADALKKINDNLAFTLDELLEDLAEV